MKLRRTLKLMSVAALALSLLPGCGKQNFSAAVESASAVAGQYTQPKLDVVMFQDDSDSMFNALGQVQPQLNSFLSNLDVNWNYRFVVLPLQSTQPLSSKYVVATNCTGINALSCLSPSQSSVFSAAGANTGWITLDNTATGNTDLGFQNMVANIQGLQNSGFLRPDAALAMVVLSNGEDVSGGVAYQTRADGSVIDIDYSSPTTINSFNLYEAKFQALKSSMYYSRFYSVVAAQKYTDCDGGGMSWAGIRYENMANDLGGTSYDICNGGLSNVLNDISTQLQGMIQAIVFNYVVIPDQPNVSSIQITKNGNPVPEDPHNGWEYVGYESNQPTSYLPTPGNNQTGYFIKMNGSAAYSGSDQISINYSQ